MNTLRAPIPWIVGALLLGGCLKEELPAPAHDRGGILNGQVCMGAGYQEQVWVDLGTNSVMSTNLKSSWDLAFESGVDGWHVMLNGSKLMTAWPTGQTDIAIPTDTAGMGAGRRIDAPSGDPDSTAIGDWRGTDQVYVIDLGYDAVGSWQGLRKMRLDGVSAGTYSITLAALDGSDVQAQSIAKDPARAYVCFSTSANAVADVEPPRGSWDLVFTQYTHQFYEPFLPYLVTGVLTDRTSVRVARITGTTFAGVSLADTVAHPFSIARNAIGYDWKAYDFDLGVYSVDPDIVYIVEDADGFFHKVHFTDFYSDLGQVGCPAYEMQEL